MPVPIGALIGSSLIGGAIGSGFGLASGQAAQSIGIDFEPGRYRQRLKAWYDDSVMLPSASNILDAENRGMYQGNTTKNLLKALGVEYGTGLSGNLSGGREDVGIRHASAIAWEGIRRASLQVPGASTALQLWVQGLIDDDELKRMLKRAGCDVDWFYDLRLGMFTKIDEAPLLAMRNRGIINDRELDKNLHYLGYFMPWQRRAVAAMREVLPTISDLIMFGVRDVWDANAVAQNKPFEDMPQQLVEWAAKSGSFGESGIDKQGQAGGGIAKWPEVYWAAHWQPMSPQMAYDAFHRLRPDRVARYQGVIPGIRAFTEQDLALKLKIADYAAGDRPILSALAFTPLRLVDIRAALQAKVRADNDPAFRASLSADLLQRINQFDRQWAIDQYRDRGLIQDDAETSADLAIARVSAEITGPLRNIVRSISPNLIKETVKAYGVGIIKRDETLRTLTGSGLSQTDSEDLLRLEDLKVLTKQLSATVSAAKRDFLAGILSAEQVIAHLVTAGVRDDRARQYAQLWVTQADRTRRTATTQQILRWLEEGLLTLDEAKLRLLNLGWSEVDQLTLLREAGIAVQRMQAKTIEAATRRQNAQAKALEAVGKQTEALRRRQIADLRAAMPRLSIQSWLRKGLVTVGWARARLLAQQYPPETVELWIRESVSLTQGNPDEKPQPEPAGGNGKPSEAKA